MGHTALHISDLYCHVRLLGHPASCTGICLPSPARAAAQASTATVLPTGHRGQVGCGPPRANPVERWPLLCRTWMADSSRAGSKRRWSGPIGVPNIGKPSALANPAATHSFMIMPPLNADSFYSIVLPYYTASSHPGRGSASQVANRQKGASRGALAQECGQDHTKL